MSAGSGYPGGIKAAGPYAPGQGLGANRWYSVGRINYSLPERKIIDSLVGFE